MWCNISGEAAGEIRNWSLLEAGREIQGWPLTSIKPSAGTNQPYFWRKFPAHKNWAGYTTGWYITCPVQIWAVVYCDGQSEKPRRDLLFSRVVAGVVIVVPWMGVVFCRNTPWKASDDHGLGHLAALVRSRRIGKQNNRLNKPNNNPSAENIRAATNRGSPSSSRKTS